MNIAICIIATGKYIRFYPTLKESIEKYFLKGHTKKFYLFTDTIINPEYTDDVVVYMPPYPWPLPSLMRFHHFLWAHIPPSYDLVYYFDVDTYLVDDIGDEVIPSQEEGLVAVSHPRNYMCPDSIFEDNPKSTAYVKYNGKIPYIHASFFGGWRSSFLQLCESAKKNIDIDFKNNVIAIWHDESHLNRYFIDHPPKLLDAGYGHPDFWAGDLPVKKKIIHAIKDWDSIRGLVPENSKGLCILAVGHSSFAKYAYNMAASVKYVDPDAKVSVFTYGDCLDVLGEKVKIFDTITQISPEHLFIDGEMHPNRFKLFLYKYTPYEYSVYVDADSLWVSKFKFAQLVDDFIRLKITFAGQCRKTTNITVDQIVHGISFNDITSPFQFKTNKMHQLHGQFLLFAITPTTEKFFEESDTIYMALKNKTLTIPKGWNWLGQPSEELAMSIATLTIPFSMDGRCDWFAPVITQDDDIKELDKVSSKKLILSINGVESYEKASAMGGYVCLNVDITKRYIEFYNQIVNEINRDSKLDLYPWEAKVYNMKP